MDAELRRELGLPQAIATVIGIVIGSGIFALPAAVFAAAQAPGLGLLAWLLGALVSLAAGLTLAELTAAMPRAGGVYVYLKEAYGDWAGFLQGWVSLIAYDSASIAAVSMVFATYVDALVPLSYGARLLLGLLAILFVTILNLVGVREGGGFQTISVIVKLLPFVLLIGFGLLRVRGTDLGPMLPASAGSTMVALAGAMLPVLFAYDGWINACALAEEIREPQRNLPLALIGGLFGVGVVYLLTNVALLGVVPFTDVVLLEKPVVTMAGSLFGPWGAQFLTVLMLISMLGSTNGMAMTAPRYYWAMAKDGLFPFRRQMSWIHPRFGTPWGAQILTGVVSGVLLLLNTFDQLYTLAIFVIWLEVAAAIGAVFVLRRRRPDLPRPYRAWGYPVVPGIAFAASLWIVWAAFVQAPLMALLGLGLVALGWPLYWWFKKGAVV